MIRPTKRDIGKEVVFDVLHEKELGVITSFNDDYVFVKYEGDNNSKATIRENLIFNPKTIKQELEKAKKFNKDLVNMCRKTKNQNSLLIKFIATKKLSLEYCEWVDKQ